MTKAVVNDHYDAFRKTTLQQNLMARDRAMLMNSEKNLGETNSIF